MESYSNLLTKYLGEYKEKSLGYWFVILVGLLAVATLLLWWLVKKEEVTDNTNEQLAVIQVDIGLYKEQPVDAGGIKIFNKDKTIYNTITEYKVSNDIQILTDDHKPISRREMYTKYGGYKIIKAKSNHKNRKPKEITEQEFRDKVRWGENNLLVYDEQNKIHPSDAFEDWLNGIRKELNKEASNKFIQKQDAKKIDSVKN